MDAGDWAEGRTAERALEDELGGAGKGVVRGIGAVACEVQAGEEEGVQLAVWVGGGRSCEETDGEHAEDEPQDTPLGAALVVARAWVNMPAHAQEVGVARRTVCQPEVTDAA